MQIEDFKTIMNKFQEEGAFTIPEEQKKLWVRNYSGGDSKSLESAIEKFLSARKDSKTPQPGQLREYYTQEVQRSKKPEDHSSKPKLSPDSMKNLDFPTSAVETILNQRAHNLIRRWRGFLGYALDGKVDGGGTQSLGGISKMADEAIQRVYGDVVKAVHARAAKFVADGVYLGVRVPPA